MGDVVGAIDGYQTYRQKYPRGQFAKDAQFFSAFLLYENGRFKRARARFKEIGGGWRAAAAWYAAWCAYRLSDWPVAEREMNRLARRNPRSRRASCSIRALRS